MALSPFDPRWDPWNELRAMEDRMSRFMRSGIGWPGAMSSGEQWSMPLDVTETDDSYRVEAAVPGIKPQDVKVSVQGNAVTIEAERKEAHEPTEGQRTTHSEHRYGRFERTFTLATAVDPENAKAEFHDGVLCLTLPKSAAARPRQIPIQGGTAQLGQGEQAQREEVEAPRTSTTPTP